ncbi:uncharacterized protein LODBEIA_P04280 [Lodderomyces beijingensis]|uniref:BRO1 domain-containing protein n=1 Tax=Lodderomyces beijingensis TaxID=1775926 RepID=A0ABP0ZDE3_9ASCO
MNDANDVRMNEPCSQFCRCLCVDVFSTLWQSYLMTSNNQNDCAIRCFNFAIYKTTATTGTSSKAVRHNSMDTNNLLYVPKRRTRAIDLGAKLSETITAKFFQPPSHFQSDLDYLSSLRDKVTTLSNDNNGNPTFSQLSSDLQTLHQYLVSLYSIDKRFPPDCVEFTWFPTIYNSNAQSSSTIASFQYEECNLIYQVGSLYSLLGWSQSRHTDEGIKKSCSYFQYAAGSFEQLRNKVEEQVMQVPVDKRTWEPPLDFQNDTVGCLTQVMLAQAQEAIWQKAIHGTTTKDSIIARLSLQTSEFYSAALALARKSSFINLEWINHITVKKFHFLAAAYLRQSLIALNASQYGEQVAFLRLASNAVREAEKHKRYVSSFVLEDLAGLAENVTTKLRVAEKDNDLIYLRIVPKENDLKPIVGAVMVKPMVPEQLANVDQPPPQPRALFADLLPYIIIHYAQAMRERQDDYLRGHICTPIQSLNRMKTHFLNGRNLPASIDSLQQPEAIPDSIMHHSREIMDHGGIHFIDNLFMEIDKLRRECHHLVDECSKRVEMDRQEDEMLRAKNGTARWTRESTDVSARELIAKTKRMRQYLTQADKGDQQVVGKFKEIRQLVDVFLGGYASLNKYLPSSIYTKLDSNLSSVITELRNCLSEWDELESERAKFVQNIEIKSKSNNILPKLIQTYKDNKDSLYDSHGDFQSNKFELVYESHLKLFDPDLSYIQTTKKTQQRLEQRIDAANSKFEQLYSSSVNATQQRRQRALQDLDTAYVKYLEIISNLDEGTKFYRDFIHKANDVLHEFDEFLSRRRVESRELELAITSKNNSHHHLSHAANDDARNSVVSPRGQKSNVWSPDSEINFG